MFGINNTIDKALNAYEKGEYEKSYALCCELLKSDSQNTCVLITIGNIFYMQNKYAEAVKYYEKAIDVDSKNYSALINLANSCYEIKQFSKAIRYAKIASEIYPKEKLSYTIMGNSYSELEGYEASINCFMKALSIDPYDAWLYNYISQSYQKNGNYKASLKNAWKAVQLGSEIENAHHINLGYLFYEIGTEKGLDSIKECVALWYKNYGQNPIVSYMCKALVGSKKVSRAEQEYVEDIFDIFAPDFESVLASLDYQAPRLIEEMLSNIYQQQRGEKLRILDLGCGTGLCGKFLQKYAKPKGLEGVDLSAKMLEEAERKKVYYNLVQEDINSYLTQNTKPYDLMVSSDVFTYFGRLDELFENINKNLENNGRLIFSISENNQDKNNYTLHPSGRFLHNINYVKNMLEKNGFQMEKTAHEKLRNEGEKKVMGYIISAKKIS